MKDFRDLKVWQKAHQLTLATYRLTKTFPSDELYGLTSQMRQSSASIPANVAEGCGRSGDNELARFLQIAMGSACEREYHALLAHDLGIIDAAHYEPLAKHIIEVKCMLASLIQKLTADR